MKLLAVGLIAIAPFGGCFDKKDDEPSNNATAPTNNATVAASNNDTTSAVSCTAALFAQTVPYTSGGLLPFSFEIPSRFGNIDASTAQQVAGSNFDVTTVATPDVPSMFEGTYIVSRVAAEDPAATMERWKDAGDTEAPLDYAGSAVEAWESESDEVDSVRFFIPIDNAQYQVTLNWRGPQGCLAERRALRELALSTIAPNPDTSFPE